VGTPGHTRGCTEGRWLVHRGCTGGSWAVSPASVHHEGDALLAALRVWRRHLEEGMPQRKRVRSKKGEEYCSLGWVLQ